MRKFNWQIWCGFLLALIALFSYPTIFVRWPQTRDFPWANILIAAVAAILVIAGLRRAFARDRSRLVKVGSSVLALLSIALIGFFFVLFFVIGRQIPAAHGSPKVAQKAPDFTLPDINNNPVTLASLLASPVNGHAPRGVLLVFYRGYW
jgi:hypothetical protein